MAKRSRRATEAFVCLGATFVLVLSPAARAQERMPPIPESSMTEAQAAYAAENGAPLGGPWLALLRSPELLKEVQDIWRFGRRVRARSPRSNQLTELAILIAAREWTQQFEWNSHAVTAAEAGLNPDIITAIAEGRRPRGMSEEEEVVYDLCIELHQNKSVSDVTYERALSALGEQEIIETVTLSGFYSLLGMVMNTARTPLPEGRTPGLERFPH